MDLRILVARMQQAGTMDWSVLKFVGTDRAFEMDEMRNAATRARLAERAAKATSARCSPATASSARKTRARRSNSAAASSSSPARSDAAARSTPSPVRLAAASATSRPARDGRTPTSRATSDKNKSGGYPPRDAHGGSDDASRAGGVAALGAHRLRAI